jgi:hypothetical protein
MLRFEGVRLLSRLQVLVFNLEALTLQQVKRFQAQRASVLRGDHPVEFGLPRR